MHEEAYGAPVLSGLSEVAGSLKSLGSDCSRALLLGECSRVALEPCLLGCGGIDGFMPELDESGAAFPSPGDACPEGRSFQYLVTLAVLALVEASRDGKSDELSVLHCVGDLLGVGTVSACQTDTPTQVELEQAAICLEA